MMNALILAAVLILSPARADDFGALFGLNPGDAIQLYHQQQAQEAERKAKQRAWDVFWGKVVEPRHKEACTFEAVAKKMGVTVDPSRERPAVYYESWTELQDFQAAFHWETGQKIDRVINVLLPRMNVIYMSDRGDLYRRGRTIDDSLALIYSLYFQYHYEYKGDKTAFEALALENQARAIDVQRWYRAEFRSKSPCAAR